MENKEEAIDRLRSALCDCFGEPITNRDQAQRFKTMLDNSESGHALSDSTIRRFFGLVKSSTNPTSSTLDVLARFLGYDSFYRFSLGAAPTPDLTSIARNTLNVVFQRSQPIATQGVLAELQFIPYKERVLITQTLILLACQNRNYGFIEGLFDAPELFDRKHYLEADTYVLNHILGHSLREMPLEHAKKIWLVWSSEPGAINYFHGFVDMDMLLVRHHEAIAAYARHNQALQARLFTNSLLFWKAFWFGDPIERQSHFAHALEEDLSSKELNGVHQIPLARAVNALLLWYNASANRNALNTLTKRVAELLTHFQKHRKAGEEPFFEYWVCEGLILTRQKELLGKCLRSAKKAEKTLSVNYYNDGALARMAVYRAIHGVWSSAKRKVIKDDLANRFFHYSRDYDTIFLLYYRWLVNGKQLGVESAAQLKLIVQRTKWKKMWETLVGIRRD
jgi:hypothetical protein